MMAPSGVDLSEPKASRETAKNRSEIKQSPHIEAW